MTLPSLIVCLAFSSFAVPARALLKKNIGIAGLNGMPIHWILPMLQTKICDF